MHVCVCMHNNKEMRSGAERENFAVSLYLKLLNDLAPKGQFSRASFIHREINSQ